MNTNYECSFGSTDGVPNHFSYCGTFSSPDFISFSLLSLYFVFCFPLGYFYNSTFKFVILNMKTRLMDMCVHG